MVLCMGSSADAAGTESALALVLDSEKDLVSAA